MDKTMNAVPDGLTAAEIGDSVCELGNIVPDCTKDYEIVVVGIAALSPEPCEVAAGASESAELVPVVEELCALGVVVNPAAVAVLSLLCETCTVEEPHHSLLGMLGVCAELFCIGSPVAQTVGVVYPLGNTCFGRA